MGRRNTAEDFWRRTMDDGACVIWTGGMRKGYGRMRWNSRYEPAHRLAFFLRLGRWPEGILRHLCNRPECVLHAVEGTHSENTMDSVLAGTQRNVRKTHCPQGHAYDEENTRRRPNGCRDCKACDRRRQRDLYRDRARLRASTR